MGTKFSVQNFKKYLTLRNFLIAGIFFVIYLMFSNLAKAIVFMAIFTPLGMLSIKTTKFIPHVGVETVTATSFFMGYMFGWPVGAFFGLILGSYMWGSVAGFSQFVILMIGLNGQVAILGAWFFKLGWGFPIAYTVGMAIRNFSSWALGIAMGADPVSNIGHTVADVIWNMIIFSQLMFVLYDLVKFI
ncbi:hypothetical protein HN789_02050 [archaeon]|jgi:hypothetical protein|nr:hypothetical protein [archaeon]MBT4021844.1 hypothetical protein [archaeon]MBT4272139.1 hypothetical protein [archaeon]MBT4460320.1 hypothetical protein [archaeon]MBT4858944.1 hypothetical protein [archaeon]